MRPLLILLIVCLLLPATTPVTALDGQPAPPLVAEAIRQRLFEAQMALVDEDRAAALEALGAADTLYHNSLDEPLRAALPAVGERIPALLIQAQEAVRNANGPVFAATRARLWTALLDASAQIVFAAVAREDISTAALWLPLREYRVSTRFSRPGADATLALRALEGGRMGPEEALSLIHI